MKVKVTHPIRDGEHVHQAGVIVYVDPEKGKRWLANDWCFEVENELPKKQKVNHEPKRTEK
jgi:hypothetical protein